MKTPAYIIQRYRAPHGAEISGPPEAGCPDQDERWCNYLVYETRTIALRVLGFCNDKGNKHGSYYRLVLNGEELT